MSGRNDLAGPVGIGRVSVMNKLSGGVFRGALWDVLQENTASGLLPQEAWGHVTYLCAMYQVTGDGCFFVFIKAVFENAILTSNPAYLSSYSDVPR